MNPAERLGLFEVFALASVGEGYVVLLRRTAGQVVPLTAKTAVAVHTANAVLVYEYPVMFFHFFLLWLGEAFAPLLSVYHTPESFATPERIIFAGPLFSPILGLSAQACACGG